jgi:hypothetical protein
MSERTSSDSQPVSTAELLEPQALVRAAITATGLTDFGSDGFWPALQRLTGSLTTEAFLSDAGRAEARRTLVDSLVRRLQLQHQANAHPEIANVQITQPIFVVSLPRSGSSFVHRLLGCHPDLHAPTLWELRYPATPPGHSVSDLKRDTEAFVNAYYRDSPDLRKIFSMDSTMPDECRWLMMNEFRDLAQGIISYRVPSYSSWLMNADLTEAYAGHQRQLQHIIWRRRRGGNLLLKSPSHIWHLRELAEVYPDARFVVLHRDPARAIASACSLTASARRKRSSVVDPIEIGQYITEASIQALRGLLTLGDEPGVSRTVLHVRYTHILQDPVAVAHELFTSLDLPLTDTANAAIERFVRTNRQHCHGIHYYSLEQFNIDPSTILTVLAQYIDKYIN